ncbi:MAG TPA: bifunctional hydroxymethylpyrimidine kinase/phosphomethylpyrimidine kinase [Candidatus Bathyarchaeota archaeon]|nr:bifunctional hydroxymethylpyrimidine kinase/phosphomethylpyrimidine kinase [Candidatus Bathyarchaeota archaeon]
MKDSVPCVLTIAGSDSGGGAGIQADLKTFAALNVHGACVITAITAQNTLGVSSIHPLPREVILKQAKAVLSDLPIEFAKVGMLFSEEIIDEVRDIVDEYRLKIVLDPVFRAGSGDPLIESMAKDALVDRLIPKALVLTPNLMEAEDLAQMEIRGLDDMMEAAKKIVKMGVKAVLLKGGHLEGREVFDLLLKDGEFKIFKKSKVDLKLHGTGCTLSSAIAAFLAKGESLTGAVEKAEKFIDQAILRSFPVGKGRVPVNQLASLAVEADRWRVLSDLHEAVEAIEGDRELARFIPEVGTQIAMATIYAKRHRDVAAVEGRIVKVRGLPKPVGRVWFGASRHLANIILTVMKHDPNMKACMNLRYDPNLIAAFRECGFTVSSFDRKLEPPEVKSVEGSTLAWGVNEAIKSFGKVPDVIYDLGEIGKEPMIRVLGSSAKEVLEKVKKAIEHMR